MDSSLQPISGGALQFSLSTRARTADHPGRIDSMAATYRPSPYQTVNQADMQTSLFASQPFKADLQSSVQFVMIFIVTCVAKPSQVEGGRFQRVVPAGGIDRLPRRR